MLPITASASPFDGRKRQASRTPPSWRAEGAEVLRDDGVVADEEEGARKDADDGDHEQGESTAGALVGEINDGRGMRWEDDVAPLGAVEAAETQRSPCFAACQWWPWQTKRRDQAEEVFSIAVEVLPVEDVYGLPV